MSKPNIFIFVYVIVGAAIVTGMMALASFIHRYYKNSSRKVPSDSTNCSGEIVISQNILGALDTRQSLSSNTVVILPFWVDHDTNNAAFIQSFIIDSTGPESAATEFEHSTETLELDLPLPVYSTVEQPPEYSASERNERNVSLESGVAIMPVPPTYEHSV
ncbi:hypothetical protein K7432_013116 [Basidiobolus ranarum]|uniref:Uncharacterized protein n=1 Tax=Basidiobolus ranarum TaxID=34480 RepID=A0ABR2VRG1_9FUNG